MVRFEPQRPVRQMLGEKKLTLAAIVIGRAYHRRRAHRAGKIEIRSSNLVKAGEIVAQQSSVLAYCCEIIEVLGESGLHSRHEFGSKRSPCRTALSLSHDSAYRLNASPVVAAADAEDRVREFWWVRWAAWLTLASRHAGMYSSRLRQQNKPPIRQSQIDNLLAPSL